VIVEKGVVLDIQFFRGQTKKMTKKHQIRVTWLIGLLAAVSIALLTVIAWAVATIYRLNGRKNVATELKDRQNQPWLPVAPLEISPLQVTGIVVCPYKTGNVHMTVKTYWKDGVIYTSLSKITGTPWPPKQTNFRVYYQDKFINKSTTVTFSAQEPFGANEQILFCKESHSVRARQVVLPIPAIPRRIIQTYRLPYLRHSMYRARHSFLQQNPGFDSVFYGNRRLREFVHKHFRPDVLRAIDRVQPGAYKSDIFRLCELYINGGVYADVGMVCLQPIEPILRDVDLVIVRDSPFRDLSYVHNAFLAALPRLPFIRFAIDEAVNRVLRGDYSRDALSITGPGILGRGLNRYAGREENTAHGLGIFQYKDMCVRILDNTGKHIVDPGQHLSKIILNRYDGAEKDREGDSLHWPLYHKNEVFLRELDSSERKAAGNVPLFQTSESTFMMPRQLEIVHRTRKNALKVGYIFSDDIQRTEDIRRWSIEMNFPDLISAFGRLLAGGARAHLWGLAAVACIGGMYLDTHVELIISPERVWDSTARDVGVIVGVCGCWAARSCGHPLFVASVKAAVQDILCGKGKHSSTWLETATRQVGDVGVAFFRTREGQLLTPSGIALGKLSYNGYEKDRICSGGESPKCMAERSHMLFPSC
jgi:hypothetical protein